MPVAWCTSGRSVHGPCPASALSTRAAAVLVDVDGTLEVLAASSHRALDLEIHQAQAQEGPCLDTMRSGVEEHEVGADAISARWPRVGPMIVASGYESVQALPLVGQGVTFGGLNLFRGEAIGFEYQQADCRAVANAVTLLIVTAHVEGDQLRAGLHTALEERAVVELAKGALAHAWGLDMASAYDALAQWATNTVSPSESRPAR
jgi:ANTAR domain